MSKAEKREIKLIMEKSFVDKVEEAFCFAQWEGEVVGFRTLVSVAKEAFLRGVHQMAKERKELSGVYGKTVYLTDGGVSFIEDIVKAYDLAEKQKVEAEE